MNEEQDIPQQERVQVEDEGEGSTATTAWTIFIIVIVAVAVLLIFSQNKSPGDNSAATSTTTPPSADRAVVIAQLADNGSAAGFKASDYSFAILPRGPFDGWFRSLPTSETGQGELLVRREGLEGGFAAFGDLSQNSAFQQGIRGVTTQEFAACFLRKAAPNRYSFRDCTTVTVRGGATTTLTFSDSGSETDISCSGSCTELPIPKRGTSTPNQ